MLVLGGSCKEKVRWTDAQETTTDFEGDFLFSELNNKKKIDVVVFLDLKALIWCQDHERAYFDSADWALGKVVFYFFNII